MAINKPRRIHPSLVELITSFQKQHLLKKGELCSFPKASRLFAKRIKEIDKRSKKLFNTGLIL